MEAAVVHGLMVGKTAAKAIFKRAYLRVIVMLTMVLAAAISVPSVTAQPLTTLPLVATIPVGNYPSWATVNQATNQIYVANFNDNTMSVINGATNQVVETLPVGNQPRSIAFNPTTNRVYVTNVGTGIKVLDAGNNFATIATIPTIGAWHVEVNPTTNIVYLTQPSQNSLAVIDGQTNTVITTVVSLPYATDVAIDTANNDYYVSDGTSNSVSHINGATNQVISTIPVGIAPDRMTYNQNTNELYVTNPLSDNISVINCATDSVVATIPVAGSPDGVASYGNAVFAVLLNTNPSANLLEFDARSNTLVDSSLPGSGAIGVAVNSQTQLVYTTNYNSNTVAVLQVTPLIATPTSTPVVMTPTPGVNVPPTSTRPPVPATPLPSATPTSTSTPVPATPLPSATPTSTSTPAPTATISVTPAPIATATFVPTHTPVPGGISSLQPTPLPTQVVAMATATALAVPTALSMVEVHNQPRTVVGGRITSCDLQTNLKLLQQGCIVISSISGVSATVIYTLTYPGSITPSAGATTAVMDSQIFTDTADFRGHSLHIFNVPYLPPAGAKHGAPTTIVQVRVEAILPDGTVLEPNGTRFTTIP